MSVTFPPNLVLVTNSVVSVILFSIFVTFMLSVKLIIKPVVLGIFYQHLQSFLLDYIYQYQILIYWYCCTNNLNFYKIYFRKLLIIHCILTASLSKTLFHFLRSTGTVFRLQFSSVTSEIELDYYHKEWM